MAEDMNFNAEPEVDPLALPAAIPVVNNSVQGDYLHNDTGVAEQEEAVKQKEADAISFPELVSRSFQYGDNTAVNLYNDMERMRESGPADPSYDPDEFYKKNKEQIRDTDKWRYDRTKNEEEATAMLRDSQEMNRQQDLISRAGGFESFMARSIAGVFDVDSVLTLATGGLSAGAKLGLTATKAGRLLAGGVGGLASGTALGTIEYQVNPTADYTTIAVMGLAGTVFGVAGGALGGGRVRSAEAKANDGVTKILNEYGETINEGMPLAKRDVRDTQLQDDHYGSMHEETLIREAEEAEAAATVKDGSGEAPAAKPEETSPDAGKPTSEAEIEQAALSEGVPDRTGIETEGPRSFDPKQVFTDDDVDSFGDAGSTGARRMSGTGAASIRTIKSKKIQTVIRNAASRIANLGIEDKRFDKDVDKFIGASAEPVRLAVAKGARRFHDALERSGLRSDYARFWQSPSAVAKTIAYDLMEDPSGILRNNRSGAAYKEHYHKYLQGGFIPYHDAFDAWANKKGISAWRKTIDSSHKKEFDEQVIKEVMARGSNNMNMRVVDPEIAKAANAVNDSFRRDIEVNTGKTEATTTKGYEGLKKDDGYFPQHWVGAKMQKMIDQHGLDKVYRSVQSAYLNGYPAMKPDMALIYAKAVVDRARRTNDGISSNVLSLFADKDSRTVITDMMRANGMKEAELDKLISDLSGNKLEKGKPGFTKKRIGVDFGFISPDGIRLMDLLDTDVNSVMSRRLNKSAGSAALARKGIRGRADWDDIKKAITEEQGLHSEPKQSFMDNMKDLADKDVKLSDQDLDNMWDVFMGNPRNGGVSPMTSRVMKLTRLATLNGLGLTQVAESATTIASIGVKRFFQQLPKELSDSMKKIDSPLVQELKHFDILVPEEKMFRDDLTHEFEKATVTGEYWAKVDTMMNKAQRLQGFTSGFYAVRNFQQRMAATSGASKIMEGIATGKMSTQRLYDAGFEASHVAQMKKYIDNKTVEFENGSLKKLNLSKWDPQDVEEFTFALNRVVNQDVQKAMIGEGANIFHKDGLAALFWQLKSFPMLALEKQAYRNLRMQDSQAMTTFLYGLGTAAAVYSVKQTIAGNTDRLDVGSVAQGAFAMSNLTGWIPMWIDPLAGMLGMDDLKFNGYGRYGGNSVFSTPASFSVMDRMVQAPAAIAEGAVGAVGIGDGLENDDIQALKVLPIIGNLYGFSYLFNAMQDYNNEQKAKAKTEAKQAETAVIKKAAEEATKEKAAKKAEPKPAADTKKLETMILDQ